MHCLGGASLEPPVPDGSRTPALFLFGRGFRFGNFQSRIGIRADGAFSLERYATGKHSDPPHDSTGRGNAAGVTF
jgi:hypothetical protein